jgi:histidine ammonia-lyase
LDVDDDEEMEVLAFVVVAGGGEFHGTEVDLAVDHLHLAFPANADIEECHLLGAVVLTVLLDCEDLGLHGGRGT